MSDFDRIEEHRDHTAGLDYEAHRQRVRESYLGLNIIKVTGGDHAGLTVTVTMDADGIPTVQIDTPHDTDTHEVIRVYLNDSRAEWYA